MVCEMVGYCLGMKVEHDLGLDAPPDSLTMNLAKASLILNSASVAYGRFAAKVGGLKISAV